jgi:hypothetical protein
MEIIPEHDRNITSFYITFSITALTTTFILVLILFINPEIFIYFLVTYVLFIIIYLHVVILKNKGDTKSTNAFTSLRQSSVVVIFTYISLLILIISYGLIKKLKASQRPY